MTASPATIQPLADLLDSRQDLREILAKNLNLAHACLLLRRGESESVIRALELALRQSDTDTSVVSECIQAELSRLAGQDAKAVSMAEASALRERFHPAASLYLRNLFPLIDPSHRPASLAGPHEDSMAGPGSVGDPPASLGDARDSVAMDVRSSQSSVHADVPPAWAPVAHAAGTTYLRLRDQSGIQETKRTDLAIGAMEEATFTRTVKILHTLGFGEMRHASFEGERRIVHAWMQGERTALAVFDNDGSASLLAARCTKAFQEEA